MRYSNSLGRLVVVVVVLLLLVVVLVLLLLLLQCRAPPMASVPSTSIYALSVSMAAPRTLHVSMARPRCPKASAGCVLYGAVSIC